MGLVIAIIAGMCIFYIAKAMKTQKATNAVVESSEFQTALTEARNIRKFFINATSIKGGTVIIVLQNIDNPDSIDWSLEKYNYCMYFRVRLDYGYSPFLALIENSNYSETERTAWINDYLLDVYGKNMSEIKNLGIDPYKLVYDIKEGEDPCEGILYYKFVCPCGLKGDAREMFTKRI